ncbi:hypothetical protein, partial [Pseudomonas syringae group genomosp. 7]|uniref:hypothetical protein n=1 Tax=Pseudomonas syringae group genomosp. 7 TaxID=251699 RepID=UPI00377032AB
VVVGGLFVWVWCFGCGLGFLLWGGVVVLFGLGGGFLGCGVGLGGCCVEGCGGGVLGVVCAWLGGGV